MHTITLTEAQLNIIFSALIERPYREVHAVIDALRQQLMGNDLRAQQEKEALEAAGDDL